jgi:hypothetical protein
LKEAMRISERLCVRSAEREMALCKAGIVRRHIIIERNLVIDRHALALARRFDWVTESPVTKVSKRENTKGNKFFSEMKRKNEWHSARVDNFLKETNSNIKMFT